VKGITEKLTIYPRQLIIRDNIREWRMEIGDWRMEIGDWRMEELNQHLWRPPRLETLRPP